MPVRMPFSCGQHGASQAGAGRGGCQAEGVWAIRLGRGEGATGLPEGGRVELERGEYGPVGQPGDLLPCRAQHHRTLSSLPHWALGLCGGGAVVVVGRRRTSGIAEHPFEGLEGHLVVLGVHAWRVFLRQADGVLSLAGWVEPGRRKLRQPGNHRDIEAPTMLLPEHSQGGVWVCVWGLHEVRNVLEVPAGVVP